MYMQRVTKLIVLSMIVWLPIAGAMAAVMPLTMSAKASMSTLKDSTQAAAGETANNSSDASNEEFAMPCHGSAKKPLFGQSCSHCVLCHLAGSLAMASMPVMPQVPPTRVFSATLILTRPSFIPDLLISPPRPSLA